MQKHVLEGRLVLSGDVTSFLEQPFALFFHKVCLIYSALRLFSHKDPNELLVHGKPEEQYYCAGWFLERADVSLQFHEPSWNTVKLELLQLVFPSVLYALVCSVCGLEENLYLCEENTFKQTLCGASRR